MPALRAITPSVNAASTRPPVARESTAEPPSRATGADLNWPTNTDNGEGGAGSASRFSPIR